MASMRQLIAGKEFWPFRTEVDLQQRFAVIIGQKCVWQLVAVALAERDVQLVVMLQSTLGLMHADELVQPWRGRATRWRKCAGRIGARRRR